MTRIKICGLTTLEDARCAAEAGSDMLGFIFFPGSPRYVPPAQAQYIAQTLRAALGTRAPKFVGVFVDASPEVIQQIRQQVGLDLLQLHGSEPPAVLAALSPYAFKAIRPRTLDEALQTARAYVMASSTLQDYEPQLLIDSYHPTRQGGTGQLGDLGIAAGLAHRYRLLLAGGLNPINVALAISQVHPWGVDVSSGVERRPGRKDHARIRAFIQAVREADTATRQGTQPSRN
ncbi:MAG TPA: phosphoribosylanthranilate isomerase [Chloroflexi bacterium]|nr:phosphoribosylanthranilate isomerase [Chloroflexota bacterium]